MKALVITFEAWTACHAINSAIAAHSISNEAIIHKDKALSLIGFRVLCMFNS
jgi:hypothetical protein